MPRAGLLLGPRGTTLKRMEDETGCKIMIRGRGASKVWLSCRARAATALRRNALASAWLRRASRRSLKISTSSLRARQTSSWMTRSSVFARSLRTPRSRSA